MKRIILILLVFICATVNAQVYRRTGPDGQVYFSDQQGPDAEQVEVAPVQTIRMTPVPGQTDITEPSDNEQQDHVAVAYTVFNIVSPTSEEGVRANDGNVTVQLSLQPELITGHRIVLKIDGEDGKETSTGDGMSFELSNLSRGLHSVEATVVDEEGNVLIQTGSVSFNVLRVSR